MFYMIVYVFIVNEDIIKINNNKLANKSSQNIIYKSHKGA